MNDCVFCKIVTGKLPSEKVYKDTKTLAFLDIHPTNPGHTLVIPKKHYRNIFDISPIAFTEIMKTVHRLAPVVKEATSASAITISMSNEKPGQEVFHAHVHIIPRFEGDAHKPWAQKEYGKGKASEIAERIKQLLVTA